MPSGRVENTDAGKTVGSPVVATDNDGDTLTYTLTDADDAAGDSAYFSIDWGTGQILTKAKLDAEDLGLDRDESIAGIQLQVMVRATDPTGVPQATTCIRKPLMPIMSRSAIP